MKITILIPVFNEEKTIGSVLNKISKIRFPCKSEIIVVDDGSTDNTIVEIKKNNSKKIKLISKKSNSGKGAAIKVGLEKATGDYLIIQDADLEYNPEEISKLLSPIINIKKTDDISAIYGSRFMKKNVEIPRLYLWGNKFLTLITNFLYGINITDMETGYKIIPVKFFKNKSLKSDRFDIEPEITAKLVKNNIKIIEIPITYKGRSHFAGKKLTLRDAFGALKALIYFRFFD